MGRECCSRCQRSYRQFHVSFLLWNGLHVGVYDVGLEQKEHHRGWANQNLQIDAEALRPEGKTTSENHKQSSKSNYMVVLNLWVMLWSISQIVGALANDEMILL